MATRRRASRRSTTRTTRKVQRTRRAPAKTSTAMWVGLAAVAAAGIAGTAYYYSKKSKQLPAGATPPSDLSCPTNSIIDAVTWQCVPICGDDSRPCNGLCIGYAGGPLTPQGSLPPFTSLPTGATLAAGATYLESMSPISGSTLAQVVSNLTSQGFTILQSFDVGVTPGVWPSQDSGAKWRLILQTPSSGTPVTVSAGINVFKAG